MLAGYDHVAFSPHQAGADCHAAHAGAGRPAQNKGGAQDGRPLDDGWQRNRQQRVLRPEDEDIVKQIDAV